jgi:hypothetical protein
MKETDGGFARVSSSTNFKILTVFLVVKYLEKSRVLLKFIQVTHIIRVPFKTHK